MTAVQLNAMNTRLWQGIGAIADSELLMKRLTKYVSKLVKEKTVPALMTKKHRMVYRIYETEVVCWSSLPTAIMMTNKSLTIQP